MSFIKITTELPLEEVIRLALLEEQFPFPNAPEDVDSLAIYSGDQVIMGKVVGREGSDLLLSRDKLVYGRVHGQGDTKDEALRKMVIFRQPGEELTDIYHRYYLFAEDCKRLGYSIRDFEIRDEKIVFFLGKNKEGKRVTFELSPFGMGKYLFHQLMQTEFEKEAFDLGAFIPSNLGVCPKDPHEGRWQYGLMEIVGGLGLGSDGSPEVRPYRDDKRRLGN